MSLMPDWILGYWEGKVTVQANKFIVNNAFFPPKEFTVEIMERDEQNKAIRYKVEGPSYLHPGYHGVMTVSKGAGGYYMYYAPYSYPGEESPNFSLVFDMQLPTEKQVFEFIEKLINEKGLTPTGI